MTERKPKTGLLLLLTAIGAGGVGFLVGRFGSEEPPPVRSAPQAPAPGAALDWDAFAPDPEPPAPPDIVAQAVEAGTKEELPEVHTEDLFEALSREQDPGRAQKMLLGLVAQAAISGPRMLPDLKRLLDEGVDVALPAFNADKPGYPSLRVALLAAVEATGDPAAAAMIAEVAQTSQSPVEIVFSAHLLDRLDALDAATAQRTLDALAQPLSKQQQRAMGAIARQVVSAAAAADPTYAENYLLQQVRRTDGPRTDPRLLAPILDGLPMERAQEVVFSTLTAADVQDRTKGMLASRAASRSEVEMLEGLRRVIESGNVSPQVSAGIARSAVGGTAYQRLERSARVAVKSGNLAQAQKVAHEYETRLAEAARTVTAAAAAGAKLPRDVAIQQNLYQQRLTQLLGQIRQAHEKQQKQATATKGS